jgi:hypothetical protein
MKNLKVAKDVGAPQDKRAIEMERRINEQYAPLSSWPIPTSRIDL